MEYRILGKTGLEVSSVGVGCWQMGGLVGESGWTGTTDEESIATIHRAKELGVNLLDTAEGYGQGHSEDVIGKALKGRRDDYVLATKVRPITDDPDETKARARILEACEGSLRRLQTDHIDVYQLHAVPHEATMPAVMDALAELKDQGKIRWFGISINDTDAIRKLLALGDLATLQVGYSLLSRSGEAALQLAKEENLGTLIRGPLASGALSGKYFDASPKLVRRRPSAVSPPKRARTSRTSSAIFDQRRRSSSRRPMRSPRSATRASFSFAMPISSSLRKARKRMLRMASTCTSVRSQRAIITFLGSSSSRMIRMTSSMFR